MNKPQTTLARQLQEHFGEAIQSVSTACGETTCIIGRDHWLDVCRELRDNPAFHFEQLIDLCGVDNLGYGLSEWKAEEATFSGFSRAVEKLGPGRFAWEERPREKIKNRFVVVVHLLSIKHNRRLRLKCFAPDEGLLIVPSLVEIWNGANWFEREAFDLFGIIFKGHPDLRRILTDYGFVGHPFRKDFPLIGNVEVIYDEKAGRVVYQPVSIKPRVNVPKTRRDDSRYPIKGQETC